VNCPHCRAPNADDARFCGSCGRATSATEPATNPNTAEAPTIIGREIAGRYRIQSKLGEGGMGAVYKAEQISLKRTIAVKLLRPEVASSQLLLRRFNAEAEAVAKLSHPNTVNIYDFGQDSDGTLFIAMEFIEGQSLRHMIHREAPFSIRRALGIALQVSSSLSDAHSRSIIHRDLKPDNVMIQTRGREKDIVRVLDFGIAKLRDENRQSQLAMTQAGDMLGTPQYMAPEQIRAEPIDGRTDVYALGCLLYEMITARLPYDAPTIMSLLSKHLLEVTVPPSQRRTDLVIPPAIDQLILSAMAKDPKSRPATMDVFGEQIADLLAQQPLETMSGPRPAGAAAQAVETPPAYSAIPGGPPPTYATHGPQMPAPAFVPPGPPPGGGHAPAAPFAPPPGGHAPPAPVSPFARPDTPPPGGYAPPPAGGHAPPPGSGGYVPAPHGAPAYDPREGIRPPGNTTIKTREPGGSGGGKALWIVIGVLVLAGGGVGIYMAARGGDAPVDPIAEGSGSGSNSGSGSGLGVGSGTGAAGADDPWARGRGSGNHGIDMTDTDVDTDTVEDIEVPDEDQPPDDPLVAGTLPPACERFTRTIERFGTCAMVPKETKKIIAQGAAQFRAAFKQGLNQAALDQMAAQCDQMADTYEQSLKQMNCGSP